MKFKSKTKKNKFIKFTVWLLVIMIIINLICPLLFYNIFGLLYKNTYKQNESLDVVISHYKEDLSWIDTILPTHARIFIYSKSDEIPNCKAKYIHVKLDNVGREGHTYLYHIISNYDNSLSENTLFLPGSCEIKVKNIQVKLLMENLGKLKFNSILLTSNNFVIKSLIDYGHNRIIKAGYCSSHESNKHSNCDLIQYKFKTMDEFKTYFHINTPYYVFQGIFMIKTSQIFNRTLDYYTDLINVVNNGDNILNGHFLEKCWYGIFTV
jgi:hypothetical protein